MFIKNYFNFKIESHLLLKMHIHFSPFFDIDTNNPTKCKYKKRLYPTLFGR